MAKIFVEVVLGVEGRCLVINDIRVAGPKPWGGGKVIKRWIVDEKDIIEALGATQPAVESDVASDAA